MKLYFPKPTFGIFLYLIFIFTFNLLSCSSSSSSDDEIYAELITNKGKIKLLLEYEKVSMTVSNFIGLTEGTIKNEALPLGTPFYDGSIFHRVVPGHVIQAGAPVGTESRGVGYTFPNEIHPDLSHNKVGMLGMANGGPHTNSNQFYITLGDRSYLDGDYTVFGHVVEGMEVVNKITKGDTIKTIKITRVGKGAESFKPSTESFFKMVEQAKVRVQEEEKRKQEKEKKIIRKNWPDLISTQGGIKYQIIKNGVGEKPNEGSTVILKYNGQFLDGRKFCSSSEKGIPVFGQDGESFEYTIGESSINSGFDKSVKEMKKGEKRIVILPASLAYGRSGFYSKEKEGEKRFVISPNTTLVYEIELLDVKK